MVPDVHEFSRHDLHRGGDDPSRVHHVRGGPLCHRALACDSFLHRDDDHRLPCDDHPACEPDAMVTPDEASESLRVVIAEDDCDPHQGRCLGQNEVA